MKYDLDERLKHSSFHIANWPLCEVRLKNHDEYPWIILIPRLFPIISEWHELNHESQVLLIPEINRASQVMKKHFHADKINIGALGNIVSQLHIHVIARFKTDSLWPHSLWQSALAEKSYSEEKKEKIIAELRVLLAP